MYDFISIIIIIIIIIIISQLRVSFACMLVTLADGSLLCYIKYFML